MAYGVKYRLEFSDVLGYGKKVEILKKDYTGSVTDLIGSGDPIKISWQSSDDFYKPIIGSKCEISLFITDTNTYDDFYKFDEREYKVVVYYAQTQSDAYYERVYNDDGQVESIECVEGTIDNFTSTNVWAEYWSGFLVVDRYKERMTTTPFGVKFNAYDGLGTLSNYNAPFGYNNNNAPTTKTNITRISEILQNLDLDLDIYISTDIKYRTFGPVTTTDYENLTTLDFGFDELKGDYDLMTAKEQLEILLRQYNLRIYQSLNRWYIVEATNNYDYFVKDIVFNEVQRGSVPTGIRNKITDQLNNTKNEYIEFRKYNYLGVYDTTQRFDILYDNNIDLKATNNDLTREYLQPVSKVITDGKYPKSKNAYYNAGFEYGDYGFTILDDGTNPYAEIATDEVSFKGKRSLKFTSASPVSGSSQQFTFVSETFNPQEINYSDFSCSIKYFFSILNTQNTTASATFQFQLFTTLNGAGRFWDNQQKQFTSSTAIQQITTTSPNRWINFNVNLSDSGIPSNSDTSATLTLSIYNTICSDADYDTTYFDNLEIVQKKASPEEANQKFIAKLTNAGTNTSSKTITRIPDENYGYFRTRDSFPQATFKTNSKTLININNQNIANDYREYVSRYTGSFRNNNTKPMSIHNKVWFYWNGIETDPQSTIIDGLVYSVKNAQYKITSHLPNDDDDEAVQIIIN